MPRDNLMGSSRRCGADAAPKHASAPSFLLEETNIGSVDPHALKIQFKKRQLPYSASTRLRFTLNQNIVRLQMCLYSFSSYMGWAIPTGFLSK